MPDSSKVTVALLTKLQTDAALQTLMPDGAWFAEAPPGAQRFVILALLASSDTPVFGRRAFEAPLYLVEARALSTSGGNVHAAFARIEALLEDGTLTVAGYALMAMCREEYVEGVEVDAIDPSLRWNRCGGHYRVQVAGT